MYNKFNNKFNKRTDQTVAASMFAGATPENLRILADDDDAEALFRLRRALANTVTWSALKELIINP